jgi:hypothetical protein
VELLEAHVKAPPPALPGTSVVEIDERAARRSLRDQIAKLERELAQAFASAYPRPGFEWSIPGVAGPRILGLGELERVRDDLAERLRTVRVDLAERTAREEENRRLIERMMLDPKRYKYVRVSREDIGERGCGHWHVRPRLGIIGMLMGWWQVKLSSGCPLARGQLPPSPHHVESLGRRSRKRASVRSSTAQPSEPVAAARPVRRRRGERPPAPWGSFPLVELCVLLALIIGVAGFITGGTRGGVMLAAAAALGSLAGLEISIREHVAGYRSHTTLLAAAPGVLTLAALFFAGAPQWAMLGAALFVFVTAYYLLRELFKRRSGGYGFR